MIPVKERPLVLDAHSNTVIETGSVAKNSYRCFKITLLTGVLAAL